MNNGQVKQHLNDYNRNLEQGLAQGKPLGSFIVRC